MGRFATSARASVALALSAYVALALAACGGDDDAGGTAAPDTAFATALASVGGGGANGSLGVGWAEPPLVAAAGGDASLIGDAIGPNADTVIEAAPQFERRYGFDPRAAERLVSVGGSYAFGLRLDGVDGRRLERALVADGATTRPTNEAELLDIGGYASVPDLLLDLDVNGLGARDAFAAERTILAISATARAALLGRGSRLLDEPVYAAAAQCFGDVAAARMVPAKLLLSSELGIAAVGVGVGDGAELICVLGGTAERADEIAGALRDSLAADAREPRTGARIGDSVAAADVSAESFAGVEYARATITPVAGQPPGFVFGLIARGTLVEMFNPS